jgi:hypothetical protein
MRHSVGCGYAVKKKTAAAPEKFDAARRRNSTAPGSTAAAINSCSLLNADVPRAGGLDVEKKLSFDESISCAAGSAVVSVSSV